MNAARLPLIALSLASLGLLATASNAQAQILAYEYRFNDSGTTTAGTGSYATTAGMWNGNLVAADMHGPAGSGVTGAAGDIAFDNTSSTGFAANGGAVSVGNTVGALDSMHSFTLSGWYKISAVTTGAYGNSALYFKSTNSTDATGRIYLYSERNAAGDGRLRLVLDESSFVDSSYSSVLGGVDEWVFFAVTYDGSKTASNVNFYTGTTTANVSLVGTTSLNLGTTGKSNTATMLLGNNSTRSAAFDGWMDNMRIHKNEAGAGNEGTGALTIEQLNTLRQVDAIPEPSVVMLGVPVVGAWLIANYRRRRQRA